MIRCQDCGLPIASRAGKVRCIPCADARRVEMARLARKKRTPSRRAERVWSRRFEQEEER